MSELLSGALDGSRTRNSHAQVVDGLGLDIVAGILPVGGLLPRDDELIARFGVSRTVLREAIKTLSAKGLLVARSRVGTRVRERRDWNMLDADLLRWHLDTGAGVQFHADLSEMRLGVEPLAAGLAARHADADGIAAMRGHVRAMADAPDDRAFAMADFDLHREIIRASGNVFMYSVGNLIEAALLSSLRISSPAADRSVQADSARAHGEIVEAIARHDPEAAGAAMRHVITMGRDRVSRSF